MSVTTTPVPAAPPKRRDFRPIYLVGPSLLILAVVIGYPILRAIYLSFQADRHIDPQTGMFVDGGFAGMQHYLYWLTQRCINTSGEVVTCAPGVLSTDFWPAVGITFFFTVVTVSLETILGLWMATVMGKSFAGRSLLRAAVLVPWAIPTAVTAKLWQFIFAERGIVNSLLGTTIHWTTDPWAARFAVIIADVWKTTPFMALLILAGLQMIPQETYEAARVDGATAWQRFTQITLPLVRPALMVAVLFRTLDALRMYDLPVIMISDSSNSPTATISQLVVEDMRQGNFNSASAISTLVFLMIFGVAYIMVRFLGADGINGGAGKARRDQRKRRKERAAQEGSELTAGGSAALPATPATAMSTTLRRKRTASLVRTYLGVIVILVWGLAPFYWMVITALRDSQFTFSTNPLPSHVTLDNFREALSTSSGNNFLGAIGNSLLISAATTGLALVVGVFAAYALARVDFPGKGFVTGIILAASMFPGIALVTPLFQLFRNIGWIGTYQALIVPNISFVLPLTVYTLTSFLHDLPWELEEAARVDGATRGQAFMRVILPLASPALFTTAILAFIATWNEFMLAKQLSTTATEPVTVAIARFSGPSSFEYPYAAIMAAGALVTVPLVIMVLIFQRRIVAGLTAGGVKS